MQHTKYNFYNLKNSLKVFLLASSIYQYSFELPKLSNGMDDFSKLSSIIKDGSDYTGLNLLKYADNNYKKIDVKRIISLKYPEVHSYRNYYNDTNAKLFIETNKAYVYVKDCFSGYRIVAMNNPQYKEEEKYGKITNPYDFKYNHVNQKVYGTYKFFYNINNDKTNKDYTYINIDDREIIKDDYIIKNSVGNPLVLGNHNAVAYISKKPKFKFNIPITHPLHSPTCNKNNGIYYYFTKAKAQEDKALKLKYFIKFNSNIDVKEKKIGEYRIGTLVGSNVKIYAEQYGEQYGEQYLSTVFLKRRINILTNNGKEKVLSLVLDEHNLNDCLEKYNKYSIGSSRESGHLFKYDDENKHIEIRINDYNALSFYKDEIFKNKLYTKYASVRSPLMILRRDQNKDGHHSYLYLKFDTPENVKNSLLLLSRNESENLDTTNKFVKFLQDNGTNPHLKSGIEQFKEIFVKEQQAREEKEKKLEEIKDLLKEKNISTKDSDNHILQGIVKIFEDRIEEGSILENNLLVATDELNKLREAEVEKLNNKIFELDKLLDEKQSEYKAKTDEYINLLNIAAANNTNTLNREAAIAKQTIQDNHMKHAKSLDKISEDALNSVKTVGQEVTSQFNKSVQKTTNQLNEEKKNAIANLSTEKIFATQSIQDSHMKHAKSLDKMSQDALSSIENTGKNVINQFNADTKDIIGDITSSARNNIDKMEDEKIKLMAMLADASETSLEDLGAQEENIKEQLSLEFNKTKEDLNNRYNKITNDINQERDLHIQSIDEEFNNIVSELDTKSSNVIGEINSKTNDLQKELENMDSSFMLIMKDKITNIEKYEKDISDIVDDLELKTDDLKNRIKDNKDNIDNEISDLGILYKQLKTISIDEKNNILNQIDDHKQQLNDLILKRKEIITEELKKSKVNNNKILEEASNALENTKAKINKEFDRLEEDFKKKKDENIKALNEEAKLAYEQKVKQILDDNAAKLEKNKNQVIEKVANQLKSNAEEVKEVFQNIKKSAEATNNGKNISEKLDSSTNIIGDNISQAIESGVFDSISERSMFLSVKAAGDIQLHDGFWTKLTGGYFRYFDYKDKKTGVDISDPANHWFVLGSIGYDYAINNDFIVGVVGYAGYSQYKEDKVKLNTPVDEHSVLNFGGGLYSLFNYYKKHYYNNSVVFNFGMNSEKDARVDNENTKKIATFTEKAVSSGEFNTYNVNIYNGFGGELFEYNFCRTVQKLSVVYDIGMYNYINFIPTHTHRLSEANQSNALDIEFNTRWRVVTSAIGRLGVVYDTLYDNNLKVQHGLHFTPTIRLDALSYESKKTYKFLLMDYESRSNIAKGGIFDFALGYKLGIKSRYVKFSGKLDLVSKPGASLGFRAAVKMKFI